MRTRLLLAPIFAALTVLPVLRAETISVSAEGYTYVKTVGAISEYTMNSNGLQVLLMPEHSAPVLTFLVTYRVGSRNEVTGTTGATHLLEHMMFKGSKNFTRESHNSLVDFAEKVGAIYNANTWLDRTCYFESIASDQLPKVVEIEADRMRNLLLRESDRQPEMTVVRNEFERGENSPYEALEKEIFASAYIAHPYHHSTIGWRSDIEKVSIEKLREFYDTFYWPNNATVSIIGDFEPANALKIVRQYYGSISRAPKSIPEVYTEEPEQTAPRRVGVKRAGELGVVGIAYKIPAATHKDYPALTVLSTILTDGKNSRMYRALTDKNLTTSVQSSLGLNHDPSLMILYASLAPNSKHEDVEKAAVAEIEKLKKDGVTDTEVSTAVQKILADAAFQRDGSAKIAASLTEFIASGDWTEYYNLEEHTRKVTPGDVKRVANVYLQEDQSTTGWFMPVIEPAAGEPPAQKNIPAGLKADRKAGPYFYRDPELNFAVLNSPARFASADESLPSARSASATTENQAAANNSSAATGGGFAKNVVHERIAGIDVLLYRTGVKDVVTFRAALPAGDALAPAQNVAIATLVGSLLDKGTVKQDKFSIAQKLEGVGATLHFSVDDYMLNISGQCLRKDVPLFISILAEQLRTPAFSPEEFEKTRKQLAGALRRQLESTDYRAEEAFTHAIYPVGHPNRSPAIKEILTALESSTLDQVKAFYRDHYGPEHMIFVAVGDLDASEIKNQLTSAFSGWTGGVPVPRAPAPRGIDGPREQTLFMPDKTSVSVVFGLATGLKYSDPDYQALRLGTESLGGGFSARLMNTVRNQEGLTYHIDSYHGDDAFNGGDWRVDASFAPTLLEKGIASTRKQIDLWHDQGITEKELADGKTHAIGLFKVALATTSGLARQLLVNAERGNDPSFLDRYPEIINSLTLDQVNGAIKKYVKTDSLVLIKAGTVPGATPNAK
ncbi:MAG TPA: pitrilysin family protein [Opitutaceae bacterium]|nr:pitrilysin family protein [Opitutaceae bacterium]